MPGFEPQNAENGKMTDVENVGLMTWNIRMG